MEERRETGEPGDQDQYVCYVFCSCGEMLMLVDVMTEKQLLEMISFQIQLTKPDNTPKPPYNTSPSTTPAPSGTSEPAPAPAPTPAPSKSSTKGKQPASKTGGKPGSSSIQPQQTKTSGRRVPLPPAPLPALTTRISPYSPALVSGVLVETVKAGMSATEAPGMGGMGGGVGGKGKRKVVRVRG